MVEYLDENRKDISWRSFDDGTTPMYQDIALFLKEQGADLSEMEEWLIVRIHGRKFELYFEPGLVNIFVDIVNCEGIDYETLDTIAKRNNIMIPVSAFCDDLLSPGVDKNYIRIDLYQYCDSIDEFKAHFSQWVSCMEVRANLIERDCNEYINCEKR